VFIGFWKKKMKKENEEISDTKNDAFTNYIKEKFFEYDSRIPKQLRFFLITNCFITNVVLVIFLLGLTLLSCGIATYIVSEGEFSFSFVLMIIGIIVIVPLFLLLVILGGICLLLSTFSSIYIVNPKYEYNFTYQEKFDHLFGFE
jgi:hypothetical protein